MNDDLDFAMDSSDEEEPLPAARRGGRGAGQNRLPLQQFLRLIAGGRMLDHGAAETNDDLVATLRRAGVITSERVARAMCAAPRDAFVPEAHAEEALVDAPIRLEELDFNISAPHMGAAMLEALQLTPGLRVLDVGSGCGLIAAAAAHMVGPGGSVVGIDVRRAAVALSRSNVRRLRGRSQEYAAAACPVRFELHNVFMPTARHAGRYDRIHVGASCPPDRLQPLLSLLRPEGGLIVVPVAPSDLRVITRKLSGAVSQRVVSQVRFSDLDVPTDAEVALATLRAERRAQTSAAPVPSTYAADMARVAGEGSSCPASAGSPACPGGQFMPSSSPSGVIDGLPPTPDADRSWPQRITALLAACSPSSASGSWSGREDSRGSMDGGGGSMCVDGAAALSAPESPLAPPARLLSPADPSLGEPDCTLVGAGWRLPAHRSVLAARCDHFRARSESGMRDSGCSVVQVPDHFGAGEVQAMLDYAYSDAFDPGLDPQAAIPLLHVAEFYGLPRLCHLCELVLGRLLRRRRGRCDGGSTRDGDSDTDGGDGDGLHDAAAALLALADDHGLGHLRAVSLDYIVHNQEAVARTESYAALSRRQIELVAAEACRVHRRLVQTLKGLSAMAAEVLPDPTY